MTPVTNSSRCLTAHGTSSRACILASLPGLQDLRRARDRKPEDDHTPGPRRLERSPGLFLGRCLSRSAERSPLPARPNSFHEFFEATLATRHGLLSLPAKPVRAEVGFVVGYGSSPRRRHLIEPLKILFGDLDVHCPQVVLQLLHSARTDDGAGYARLLLAPRERNLPRRAPLLRGNRFDRLHHREGFLCEVIAPHTPRL